MEISWRLEVFFFTAVSQRLLVLQIKIRNLGKCQYILDYTVSIYGRVALIFSKRCVLCMRIKMRVVSPKRVETENISFSQLCDLIADIFTMEQDIVNL